MKKYLISGAMALALGFTFVSCSDDDEWMSYADAKVQAFDEAFTKIFGKIDPKQDWGFGEQTSTEQARMTASAYDLIGLTTRSVTVNGDTYNKFPSAAEVAAYFPTAIPANADEVSQLETLYKGTTVQTQYGETTVWDIYAIYQHKIVEGYNLKVTSGGTYTNNVVELGGNYQNATWDGGRNMNVAHPYNVYVNVDGNLTIRRVGATHFNLYILKGNVTLESGYGEQAGIISVASGATLNDARSSIAANQGVKLFNRGTVNATNTTKYDVGNFCTIYNEGKFNVSGPLTYSPADANNSYFMNLGDDAELTAPAMTLNSTGNFFNDGKVTITGETNVTQQQIFWVNAGHYTTGTMTFSAKNNTFFNYCQLIVLGNAHMYDGEFNLMENSYTEAGSAGLDNFIVNMGRNTGMYIKGDVRMIAQGDGTFQGFRTNGSNDYLLIDGKVTVDAHYHTFSVTNGITYSINQIEIVRDGSVITEEYLQSVNDGAYPVLDLNGTECPYGSLNVTPNTTSCGATWNADPNKKTGTVTLVEEKDGSFQAKVEYWRNGTVKSGRIFCEDLAKADRGDIDFNDAVFDAYIYDVTITKVIKTMEGEEVSTETERTDQYTKIDVLACGGTLPLTVAGTEVHSLFKQSTTTMINTIGENSILSTTQGYNPKEFKTIEQAPYYSSLSAIPVVVKYEKDVKELNNYEELGQVPHMICVPIGTPWPQERVAIGPEVGSDDTSDCAFPGFADYVANSLNKPWNTINEGKVYEWNHTPEVPSSDINEKYFEETTTYNGKVRTEYSVNVTQTIPDPEGNVVYTGAFQTKDGVNSTLVLNGNDFNTAGIDIGKKVRIYGVGYDGTHKDGTGWELSVTTTSITTFNVSELPNFKNVGYIDIDITANNLDSFYNASGLPRTIQFSGKAFCILAITIVQ